MGGEETIDFTDKMSNLLKQDLLQLVSVFCFVKSQLTVPPCKIETNPVVDLPFDRSHPSNLLDQPIRICKHQQVIQKHNQLQFDTILGEHVDTWAIYALAQAQDLENSI
ncbi:hypothetical protein TSAR_015513 [Trichomalopsis sarcophagae]|uniref:Uncharacterized protein n=1 Tax=Trichomalopsis sarcophagae TaxID=543379 RepID=A0A232F0A5_9HYME|nr:hypothetical protein TSAR_015513 [Trichomalopsis sarcophagae]